MADQFDVDLVDHELLDELEMTADLIIAAGESDAPLTPETIDRVLGIAPADPNQLTVAPSGLVPRPRLSGKGQ